jgi:hypothetical protein
MLCAIGTDGMSAPTVTDACSSGADVRELPSLMMQS